MLSALLLYWHQFMLSAWKNVNKEWKVAIGIYGSLDLWC